MLSDFVVFGDETVFAQKRARRFSRFIDLVAGFSDCPDLSFHLCGATLRNHGYHVHHLSRTRAAGASEFHRSDRPPAHQWVVL